MDIRQPENRRHERIQSELELKEILTQNCYFLENILEIKLLPKMKEVRIVVSILCIFLLTVSLITRIESVHDMHAI